MRIQNWGWTHIQLTGKENVSMYYCTVLCCTTILLHTLFYLSTVPIYVHEDTPKTHTGHESLFGHLAVYYVSCHRRLVVVVVVVGLVTNSLYDRVHASGVMPIPFSRLLGRSVGFLISFGVGPVSHYYCTVGGILERYLNCM